jgi:hypothetical protein
MTMAVCAVASAAPRPPGWSAAVFEGLNVRADSTGAISMDAAGMTLHSRLTDSERLSLALIIADPSLPATLERGSSGATRIHLHVWTESDGSEKMGGCRSDACGRLLAALRTVAREHAVPGGDFRSLRYGAVELRADGTLVKGGQTTRVPTEAFAAAVSFFTSSTTLRALTEHCSQVLYDAPSLPFTLAIGDTTLTVDLMTCGARRQFVRAQLDGLCGDGGCQRPYRHDPGFAPE